VQIFRRQQVGDNNFANGCMRTSACPYGESSSWNDCASIDPTIPSRIPAATTARTAIPNERELRAGIKENPDKRRRLL